MNAPCNKRKDDRVEFSRGIDVQIVAIDGTWNRQCVMLDVAEDGAKLAVETSIKNLNLSEFFLILSTTGSAFRRCELAWVNGDQIGVRFLTRDELTKTSPKKKSGGT